MEQAADGRHPDVIVVGASAGGVEALKSLVRGLPPTLDAAVFVVLHVPATGTSVLPRILSRASRLQAVHPHDGEHIERGRIYVAPPDHHLVLDDGRARLLRGPRVNNHRPAVDPLFRSAARDFDSRVVGVVLSGALDDGTAGLRAVKDAGGITVAQDPADALYPSMPQSAVDRVAPDFVRPAAEIGPLLVELTSNGFTRNSQPEARNVNSEGTVPDDFVDVTAADMDGELVSIACPECNGSIWKSEENGITQLRCHVGHSFTLETFLERHAVALEEALWTALRTLQERATMARGIASRLTHDGHSLTAARFEEQASSAIEHAEVIRHVLRGMDVFPAQAVHRARPEAGERA